MKQFLADKCIPVLESPPQITGLTPLWLIPVPQSEKYVEGTRFQSVDGVKSKTADLLNRVSPDDIQRCFEQWKIN
jgi:hypothetical protein